MGRLLTVKMLKPYYIKTDPHYIHIVLAYRYFAIILRNEVYQFIPTESKEIKVNRNTQKIVNVNATFAFQRKNKIIYIPMSELISLPDFLFHLYAIVDKYNNKAIIEHSYKDREQTDLIIEELERSNIKRLIDKSLDMRDEETFKSLVKLL